MMLQIVTYQNDVNRVHYLMINRYLEIIEKSNMENKDYWIRYCNAALRLKNSDKLSRWVGFIQGVLYANKMITIAEERDFSRQHYKPVYNKYEIDSDTVNV